MAQQNAEAITSVTENVLRVKSHSHQNYSRGQGHKRSQSSQSHSIINSRSQSSSYPHSSQQSSSKESCGRCGQIHRYKCPAANVKCRSCNRFGHFAQYCFQNRNVRNLESENLTDEGDDCSEGSIVSKKLIDESANCTESFFLGTIEKSQEYYSSQSWRLNINVNISWIQELILI